MEDILSESCKVKCIFSIGNCNLHLKQYEKAIGIYEKALQGTGKDNYLIHFNKGMAFY